MNNIEEKRMEQKIEKSPIMNRILQEMNARYPVRQKLIREIESETGNKLITYITPITFAPGNSIMPDDISAIRDLLANIDRTENLDLLINSPGGDPNVAEKIITLCRANRFNFRVIVANYAKSAATLICLAANTIIMGDTSELGPIDPQVIGPKIPRMLPARCYIDSYNRLVDEVNKAGQLKPAYVPLLANIDLAFIDYCEKAMKHTKFLAEKWLKDFMLRGANNNKIEEVVKKLLSTHAHGQVINWEQAKDIGLQVEYLPPDNRLWQLIWELYCRSELYLRYSRKTKLFENDTISLEIAVRSGG